ncbi:ABC transporter permease [Gordonia desulfuricans]|uniref:ABC transporter permease n=1 Tax=Gordonia desulfuricans TaxID=89051 RepID=A0A7K3LJT5_9ACTN|nr:ABC transporter permease [Gordonia desulfuricans]NDK88433.1 ABC transporter permease [Gordonia desulfuricans]
MSAPSASSAIWLIARREIVTRAKTRSFVITTGALMLIIIVGSIIWSALSGGGPSTERVGLVGDAPGLSATLEASGKAAGTPIDVVTVPSEQQARDDVSSGDLDAAIVAGPSDQFVLLGISGVDDTLAGIVHASIDQSVLAAGLAEHGVDPASLPRASIRTEETSPTKPDEGQRIAVALVGSILLMMAIMTGGAMVAVGVVEEKTSRIVEILLATVKPLHLLWGKILGIGLIALVQVVLLGATALIAGAATGLLTIAGTAIGMFAAVLVWFVLGFLFFAILYAATGALVSRQEELNSAITPLTVLSLAVLYAGIFGIQALDSTFITVLSWIPPFSAVLMPIRIATGDTDVVQVIVTVVLMIAACLLATWLSARIYQRSILRTGTRVSFREALSMAR